MFSKIPETTVKQFLVNWSETVGKSEANKKTIAVLWASFGPYHYARLRALSKFANVIPIEIAAVQKLNAWTVQREIDIDVITLSPQDLESTSGFKSAVRVWQVLSSTAPEAVLIPGYSGPINLAAALWANLHSRPAVLMSDSTVKDRPRHAPVEWLKSSLLKLYGGALVAGTDAMEYLQSLGWQGKPIVLKYDVVDNEFFASASRCTNEELIPSERRLCFLYVGRLAPEKNLQLLLRAFSKYAKRGGKWKFIFVGDGPEKKSLEGLVDELGIRSSVQFRPFCMGNALVAHYHSADALVLPSKSEPWGLVVNEAMACGLPILVSNQCGCARDLVEHQGNGFTFDPFSESEIQESLARISSIEPEERRVMGDRSREVIAGFTPDIWAKNVLGLVYDLEGTRRYKS